MPTKAPGIVGGQQVSGAEDQVGGDSAPGVDLPQLITASGWTDLRRGCPGQCRLVENPAKDARRLPTRVWTAM